MACNYDLFLTFALHCARILSLAFGGYFLIGIVGKKIRQKFIQGRHDELGLELIAHVVSYALFFGISVAILHELGINVSAFLGMAGIIGVAVGYAAQSSMSNLISGLFLLFERPFKIGDELIVNGIKGHVADVNLFALVLRDASNTLITLAHDQYRKGAISNLSAMPLRRYDFCIEVQNADSLVALRGLIEQAIEVNEYRARDRQIHIEIIKIYAYTTTCAIGVWVRQENMASLKSQILAQLKGTLEQHGIALSAFYVGHDKGTL